MKKLTILIVLGYLCLNFRVSAQDKTSLKGLQPGDRVPATAGLGTYQGKLLILDFWATWCSPCRAMVPKIDSLNSIFDRQALILPVTYEPERVAGPILQKLHRGISNRPAIYRDSVLRHLFPHVTLPHYVWIDAKGIVRALMESQAINEQAIRLALIKDQFPSARKEDLRIPYNPAKPLFLAGNGGPGNQIQYSSLLSAFVPGLPAGLDVSPRDTITGQIISARNVPLLWLFRLSYGENGRRFPFSRIRNHSRDSAAMRSPGAGSVYEQWLASGHGYCYELRLPYALSAKPFPIIREDMVRLFPQYTVSVEKIKTRCLVLSVISPDSVFKAREPGKGKITVTPYACNLTNVPLRQFMQRLEGQYLQLHPLPMVDASGYKGKVSMAFRADMTRPESINEGLKSYGLAFREMDAETEMLVIRDTRTNKTL